MLFNSLPQSVSWSRGLVRDCIDIQVELSISLLWTLYVRSCFGRGFATIHADPVTSPVPCIGNKTEFDRIAKLPLCALQRSVWTAVLVMFLSWVPRSTSTSDIGQADPSPPRDPSIVYNMNVARGNIKMAKRISGSVRYLQTRFPVFDGNSPSLMISPAAVDLQVSEREPFSSKSQPPNQGSRGFVSGLNIRLKAMESLDLKCIAKNGSKPSRQISPAVVRLECVVPQIGRTEAAMDNFTNIDDASQLLLFGDNPISAMRLAANSLQISSKF
jgi:hypothetical protein